MVPSGSQVDSQTSSSGLLRVLLISALLVPMVSGLLLSWHSMGGLDIWMHNQVGAGILAGEGYPRTNTYSYTEPEHSWTNHEWLFQVLVAFVGPDREEPLVPGINRWNVLRVLLSTALLALLFLGDGALARIRRSQGTGWGWCWLALPFLLGLMLLWVRLTLRPELVSFLFFVFLVRTLDRPLDQWTPRGDWRDLVDPRHPLGRALALMVVWSQFHGFSSLGPWVLVLAIVCRFLQPTTDGNRKAAPRPRGRLWLLSVPLLLAGLCATPNGLQGLLYPVQALGQFRGPGAGIQTTISELLPLLETTDGMGSTQLAYKVSLIWGLAWIALTWGRTSLLRILLWAAAAYAAFAYQRNVGFYAVTFILLHTGTSGVPLVHRIPGSLRKLPGPVLGAAGIALALLVAVPWWLKIANDDFYLSEGIPRRFGAGAMVGRYPDSAARLLAGESGFRLFTNLNGAAFLLDRAEPRLFIDGRTEAYTPAHWRAYEEIKKGDDRALALLEQGRPDGVFLTIDESPFWTLAQALLKGDRWNLAYYDETGFFFKPRNSPSTTFVPAAASTFSLKGALPGRNTALSPTRAADLCGAWANVMHVGGAPDLEERALRRGLEFRPDHPALQHNLGNIILARGNYALALPLFEGALGKNPRLDGSAQNAGVCFLRLERMEEARKMFDRAARINPRSFAAWANLSSACLALDDRKGARKALKKAGALKPGDQLIRKLLLQVGG